MKSAYTKGRRFEYKVRDELRKLGFAVYRTSRSSGLGWQREKNEVPVDLIAIKNGKCILVECKSDISFKKMGRRWLSNTVNAEAPYIVVTPSNLDSVLERLKQRIERGEL